MKGKIVLATICVAVILLSSHNALPVSADNHPACGWENIYTDFWTRYMTSNQVGNAYSIEVTQSSSAKNYECWEFGLFTVYWGFRAWKVKSDGSKECITPDGTSEGVVQRSNCGKGIQTGSWNLTQSVGLSCSILIGIYFGTTSNPDLNIVNFTTADMGYGILEKSVWQMSYYTEIERDKGGWYYYRYYWGAASCNSHIDNFGIKEYWRKLTAHMRAYDRSFELQGFSAWYWQSLAMFNDTICLDSDTGMEAGIICHEWNGLTWYWYYYITYWEKGTGNAITEKHLFTYNLGSDVAITIWQDPSDSWIWHANFYNSEGNLNATLDHPFTFPWSGLGFGSETESFTEPLSNQYLYEIAESNHVQAYDSNDVMTPLINCAGSYISGFQYVNGTWEDPFNSFYTWITH